MRMPELARASPGHSQQCVSELLCLLNPGSQDHGRRLEVLHCTQFALE
jgi:hypothetical protein